MCKGAPSKCTRCVPMFMLDGARVFLTAALASPHAGAPAQLLPALLPFCSSPGTLFRLALWGCAPTMSLVSRLRFAPHHAPLPADGLWTHADGGSSHSE